jgi:hypothetical protein
MLYKEENLTKIGGYNILANHIDILPEFGRSLYREDGYLSTQKDLDDSIIQCHI